MSAHPSRPLTPREPLPGWVHCRYETAQYYLTSALLNPVDADGQPTTNAIVEAWDTYHHLRATQPAARGDERNEGERRYPSIARWESAAKRHWLTGRGQIKVAVLDEFLCSLVDDTGQPGLMPIWLDPSGWVAQIPGSPEEATYRAEGLPWTPNHTQAIEQMLRIIPSRSRKPSEVRLRYDRIRTERVRALEVRALQRLAAAIGAQFGVDLDPDETISAEQSLAVLQAAGMQPGEIQAAVDEDIETLMRQGY